MSSKHTSGARLKNPGDGGAGRILRRAPWVKAIGNSAPSLPDGPSSRRGEPLGVQCPPVNFQSKDPVTGAQARRGVATADDGGDAHLTTDITGILLPALCIVLCYSSDSPLFDRVTTPALPSTVIT